VAIKRWAGTAPGRSRTVAHGGLVWSVATAREKSPSMKRQTEDVLAIIDRQLAEAGTDKSKLLTATVYVADMARKPEMNEAWVAWVDPDNAPQRACVEVKLEGNDLVEIAVCAATTAP
jgi:enamine deaminase RidA (YjgF/YER057c/UK114 family)